MILRARVVVTMDGPPIENGAVAISGNRIDEVGKFPEIAARHSGKELVDLGEQALLPGLINAHCHLDYTCLRGKIPRPQSFAEWIRAINAAKAKLGPEDYVASINRGFAEAKRFGTTTIANLTAFPDLISRVQSPIRAWWFGELIDIRTPERAHEMVDLAVESLKSAEHWGLAPHAPFTASVNLYRRCQEIAGAKKSVLLTTHLAESVEEMSMFRNGSGPLYEFIKQMGRDLSDCNRHGTPLEKFVGATGRHALPWIVVHLNELSESDFDLMAGLATKFSIVHCPRSHEYFGHSPFQFEKLRSLGFNVCLGTDSLASNDNLSLFAEMRQFHKNFPAVSPEKILSMVTTNSAEVLRQEDVLGKIRPGFYADSIAVPCARPTNVFEEILAFDQGVNWLMLDGTAQKLA
jgi:aminodeoxyfutalosine deaminase